MKVSVIVPTYNGALKLPSLLEALQKQTYSAFELIIAIDGSTDNTEEVIKKYEVGFTSHKVVAQQNKGRAAIRNFGAQHASGELLIFYDDDMIPATDSVSRHFSFHQHHQGLCTGSQREQFDFSKSDIHNYKAYLSKKWLSAYPAGISKLTFSNLFFTAANCSMLRSAFDKLHGFDSQLQDGEDYDLAFRAIEAGVTVYFDKDNKAIHASLIDAESYIARLREYNSVRKQLKQIHPFRAIPYRHTSAWKKLVYQLFAFPYWVRWMNDSKFKFMLPVSVRYKIYDWVTHALTIEFPDNKIK